MKVLTLIALAMSASLSLVLPVVAADRPNVVIMLADDLGYGDLGCYPKGPEWGEEAHIATPHLDAIAAGGVQFMQGYSTGLACSPSRAGLLSGQFNSRWGYYGFEDSMAPIPSTIKLLPEVMHDAGYATGMFGKWHLSTDPSSLPLKRGFDRFFGFLGGQHDYYYSALGQTFHGVGWAPDGHVFEQDAPVKGTKYLTEDITDRAIAFMDESKKAGKPFFVYLPYNAPHTPHQVPWADLEPFMKGNESRRPSARDIVRAMIINMDRNIGRVDAWLRENGVEENTLVFFGTDNGGSDGGPGKMTQHNGGLRGRKGTYYEGGVRGPFIVRWPKRMPAGVKYDKPVSHVDLFVTLVPAAGATTEGLQKLDGVDLVTRLANPTADVPKRTFYWTREGPNADQWAVRDGDLKLVVEDDRPETMSEKQGRVSVKKLQFFDLAADPNEKNDLLASRPEDVKRLQGLYDAYIASCAPTLYTSDVRDRHRAALAARLNDPALAEVPTATGSPGHWIGKGGAGRATEEGVQPPLPTTPVFTEAERDARIEKKANRNAPAKQE